MHPLLRLLLWSNVVMAASAAAWAVVAIEGLDLRPDPALPGLAFALALAFYTRDRLERAGWAADRAAMPARTSWVGRNAAGLRLLAGIGFGLALLLALLRPSTLPPLAAGLGFALSYTVRWLPWRGERVGWKHLPGFKMPFVAALWSLLTVITPAYAAGQGSAAATWLLAAAVCCLVMVQILLNDLRDIDSDRASGVRSLPVLIGDRAARPVGVALLAAAGLMAPAATRPLIGGAALFTLLLLALYQPQQDERWRLLIEAQGLVAAALIPLLL